MSDDLTELQQIAFDYADEIAEDLVSDIFRLTDDDPEDTNNVAFCIFVWMIHRLAAIGWTTEELQHAVAWHVANQNGETLQ